MLPAPSTSTAGVAAGATALPGAVPPTGATGLAKPSLPSPSPQASAGPGASTPPPGATPLPAGTAALQAAPNAIPQKGPAPAILWDMEHVLDKVRLDRCDEAGSAPPAVSRTDFSYSPGAPINALTFLDVSPPVFTVTVPADAVTTNNVAYKGTRLWGTDVYTCESDLVCMLAHLGYIDVGMEPPAHVKEFVVTMRVTPPATGYGATTRCGLRSRRINGNQAIRCSYMVEACTMKLSGEFVDERLYPTAHVFHQPLRVNRPKQQGSSRFCLPGLTVVFDLSMDPCLKYTLPMVMDTYEAIEDEEEEEEQAKKSKPTKAKAKKTKAKASEDKEVAKSPDVAASPDGGDQPASMQSEEGHGSETAPSTSEQDGSGGESKEEDTAAEEQPKVNKATAPKIQIDTSRLTSARLRREAVYMETTSSRYELIQLDGDDKKCLTYQLSKVICPQMLDQAALSKQTRPLPPGLIEVLYTNLSWTSIKWSPEGVTVKGLPLPLTCIRFVARTTPAKTPAHSSVVSSFNSSQARARVLKQKRKAATLVVKKPLKLAKDAKGDDAAADGSRAPKAAASKVKESGSEAEPSVGGGAEPEATVQEELTTQDAAPVAANEAGADEEEEAPNERASRRAKDKKAVAPKVEKSNPVGMRASKRTRTAPKDESLPEHAEEKRDVPPQAATEPAASKAGRRSGKRTRNY